jgi:hypothetical protein
MEFIAGLETHKPKAVTAPTLRTAKARKPYMTQEIRDLIVQRNAYGADTPKGHAASNLIEQLQNLVTAEGEQRERLLKAIPYQMRRLAQATALT